MLTLVLAITIAVGLVARKATAANPVRMTERGSGALVWLAKNPRPGTRQSRHRLELVSRRRVWRGLRLAGVYYPLLCIHRHESTNWHIVNWPYQGGMQMDSAFAATYGPDYTRLWGGAANWAPWAQLVASYRAVRVRGYSPWPNTSRMCGL